MQEKIYRCYVEKRPDFDAAAKTVQNELSEVLRLADIKVRIFNRYDIQGIPHESWQSVKNTVLSEPMCDICYDEILPLFPEDMRLLYVENLPGQFSVRADSCEQCIQMLLGGQRPIVRTAIVYAIESVDDAAFNTIKKYLINPVECREASPNKPDSLIRKNIYQPDDIPVIKGFIGLNEQELEVLIFQFGLAMSLADIHMIQKYYIGENREPTITELRVFDTYWSDHCRHTTFNTVIESADIHDERVKKAYDLFLLVNTGKPVTLMNMATAAMRYLRNQGKLPMLDISDENNACTVRINASFTDGNEDWLLFFKTQNEQIRKMHK